MAQKRDKEETELKVPESLPICSPPVSPPPPQPQPPSQVSSSRSSSAKSPERSDLLFTSSSSSVGNNRILKRPREKQVLNRCSCSGCKRKLGLMGFRCRCGDMFCSEHRYSDRHNCSFDYKAAGREAIARENPIVRAAKILKV